RGRHCGRCPQASVQAALRAGPTPPARLYVHVFDQVDAPTEPLRRDVEVIGFGIERFVQMIPLFFQDGVRQQWTASARALMREIDPQRVEYVRRLASEGLALIAKETRHATWRPAVQSPWRASSPSRSWPATAWPTARSSRR